MTDPKKIDLSTVNEAKLQNELRARAAARSGGGKGLINLRAPELAGHDDEEIFAALREQQKVIYGMDDRREWSQIVNPSARKNADGVAALLKATDLSDRPDGTVQLNGEKFGDGYSLCEGEPFLDQPCCAFCTGFLVAPDLIATAGHCVKTTANLDGIRFVFGFRGSPQKIETVVRKEDVYRGKELVGHVLTEQDSDWSVVRLDREAMGRPVLQLRREGKIADDARLYVLGHPCGLPLKYAPGAQVRSNSKEAFFVANLDTYGGNSGSPVFNEETHAVEGILVRGDTDFITVGDCQRSMVVPSSGGRGEDVTRIAQILGKV